MKPFIWQGTPPDIIFCQPEKNCVMKIEEISEKSIWWGIRYKGESYDSFFGKTAHSIDEAKKICEEIYGDLTAGRKTSMLLQNKLP